MSSIITYDTNETVETKIIFNSKGKPQKGVEIWIEARIEKFNPSDNTYDIQVLHPTKHRVRPRAVHVPFGFLRKMVHSEGLQTIISVGFSESLAREALDMAGGNLDLALSCICDEQDLKGQKSKYKRQISNGALPDVQPVNIACGNTIHMPTNIACGRTMRQAPGRSVSSSLPRGRSLTPPIRTGVKAASPKKNEFDYTVTWYSSDLGFDILAAKNGRNAMVGSRHTPFAKENLYAGSLILEVGDTWVVGKSTQEIERFCKQVSGSVTIRFRGKSWMKKDFNERGTLKILVVAAQALYKPATHVTVRVSDALLSTNKVKKDEYPSWEELCVWKSFRADHNKYAIIRAWQYNRFTSNVCCGRGK